MLQTLDFSIRKNQREILVFAVTKSSFCSLTIVRGENSAYL